MTPKSTCDRETLFNTVVVKSREAMKKKAKSTIRELAYYSSIGLSVAFAIFIGLFIGVWLDGYFHTTPIFTLIFLGFGVAAGISNMIRAINRSRDL